MWKNTEVIFIRHGETDFNKAKLYFGHSDPDLNATGMEQLRNTRVLLEKREKTPDRQISIAERNNILIIRTEELLKLFEAFRNKKIKTEKIIKLFNEQIGEFKYGEE